MKFDLGYLKELAQILDENNLTELSIRNNEQKYILKREKQEKTEYSQIVMPSTVTSQIISSGQKETKGRPIVAPMVGTFYASPSLDEEPFVQVGDTIAKGQVICIIEAMKLMNEIEAEASGRITEICVKNGDSVEIGQVLMYVE